jgi:hypothetical protein
MDIPLKNPPPPADMVIPWPHQMVPPNYRRAVDFIIEQVLDYRRGEIEYDFTNQRYVFHLPIQGTDIYLHPCLGGHSDVWLILRQPKVDPIDFCYSGL